ncbi:MAG: PAS domain S-box protein [Patescibacteria group bacterium]|jgi:PAS domain S-box-containing protein|nr:PAS domain S-box protein [Patescibacteria group bacterium]
MELLKFQNENKKDKFYGSLLESLMSLQKTIDLKQNSFNLNEFFLLVGEDMEKNGVSILITIFSDKNDLISVRYLNDVSEDKVLRKSFNYFFLDTKIKVEKENYFASPYLKKEAQYIPERQKDIYKTYHKTTKDLNKISFNSIICPVIIRGETIGFFEFLSPKIKKEYLELLDNFVQGTTRSISSLMLFNELKDSEEKFKNIFENAEEGFYILNGKKKKFVEVNKALVKISGYTKDELFQMNYITLFSKEERDKIDAYVKHRLKNKDSLKSPKTYETVVLTKNGVKKNIKLKVGRYINDEEWFVVIKDISNEKNAWKKLKEANENQTLLNDLMQISINNISLDEKLTKLLNRVINIPWAMNDLSGAIWLLPGGGKKILEFFSSKNFPKEAFNTCSVDSLDSHNFGTVILNKKIEIYEGKIKKDVFGKNELINVNSCYIPLMHNKTILGSLRFLFKEKREFNIVELDFFKAVANIFSSAIDREKNKIELEKSEEKYRELIDNAGDMFVMLSLDGEILFANQSFYYTFPKKQINENNGLRSIIHKDYLNQFDEKFKEILDNKGNHKIEFKVSKKNIILFVDANFTNIVKDGKKIAVQAIIRDITDTKIAEQKLYETKKHYISVIDSIREGIFVVDKNSNIISYNKFFAEKVDLPVEKIKGKKCSKILPRYENNLFAKELSKKEGMKDLLTAVFKSKEAKHIERKIIFKKKAFFYKIDISPTKNKKNEAYQSVVTINNITESREAEEEIRKLDEFKNRVLNNVPVSIAMLDKHGKIVSLNKYAQELMGQGVINKKLVSTNEIKNSKRLTVLYTELIKRGKSFKYENLSYQTNEKGDIKYLNLIAAPLFDRSGKVEGAISMAVDNTESTIYREKIENLNQDLEQKVKQRTSELDIANKNLNRALDLKLKFISDASHELRTPLTIMKGNLDLLFLDEKIKDENVLEVYRDIEDEIIRMSHIISELTMLTNADSEMEKLYYEEVDVVKVLESVVKSLTVIAREKNISLNFKYFIKKVIIKGDEAKLDKIFINLVRNAIKYTDENGWVKIYINKNNKEAVVRIVDNGIGIPEKDLSNIFERFYRVDKARSREEGGTGLGLAISKWIVNAHNGKIEVKSEEGVGSEFTVKLPLNQENSEFANRNFI